MPPTASGNLPHKATNGSTMDILSGYLTTVQLKSQQDALGGSRDPASAPVPAPRPMQKRKEQVDATITTTSTCGAPSFGEYSAISSAAAGFPFQVDESTQFQYLMAPLPQDVAVKAEGADMMGGLDPHYFEQYGGEHLPSSMPSHPSILFAPVFLSLTSTDPFWSRSRSFCSGHGLQQPPQFVLLQHGERYIATASTVASCEPALDQWFCRLQ